MRRMPSPKLSPKAATRGAFGCGRRKRATRCASTLPIRDVESRKRVVPKQHISSIFDLPLEGYAGCFQLMRSVKKELNNRHSPAGFNLSVNNGRVAGQTVEHAHAHVVPRYEGDLLKPNGLLREALPGPGGT